MPICQDCEGFIIVGAVYECKFKNVVLDAKTVDERKEVKCDDFKPFKRSFSISMVVLEMGITTVYGDGSVQIPRDIRRELEIKDGDKILWVKKGGEYFIRKVGARPFRPIFR